MLELVDNAFGRGINISVGAYPNGAASTVVGAAMFSGEGWRERMGSTANNFQLGPKRMTEEHTCRLPEEPAGNLYQLPFSR